MKEYIGERSINQVAKDIGIPTQTLHRYVNCQREIGLETLVKIADYFDVTLDEMVGRI
ncbi:MAG: helix-turn-helix transcriptional regulator [Eubacteriales bacterium]|nr:helix-turn-helix transcriptional regulator [Eubacteriales bacterium]